MTGPAQAARHPAALWLLAAVAAAAGLWLLNPRETRGDRGAPAVAAQPSRAAAGAAAVAAPTPVRAAPARRTVDPSPVPPTAPAGSAGPPAEAPDRLAGPISDPQLQQLLDSSTTNDLPAELLRVTSREAWRHLVDDLSAARWTQLRLQATAGESLFARAGEPPVAVTVTLLWSGTSPMGQRTDRRVSTVQLVRLEQRWEVVGQLR